MKTTFEPNSKRQEKIEALASAVDSANDAGDAASLEKLDKRLGDMLRLSPPDEARLWYFRSNVQAGLQNLLDPQSWNWRQPHRERQILYLRRARSGADFDLLDLTTRTQVATNLANTLNSLGRSIEALQIYNQALDEIPCFAMAIGNRGVARAEFAQQLYDPGHVMLILKSAADDFSAALSDHAKWISPNPQAVDFFQKWYDYLWSIINSTLPNPVDLHGFSLGRTKTERRYRRWALDHELFLSPLMVLGPNAIAARDPFGLPPHRAKIGDPPHFIAWFNLLKQEFAAARLMLFESIDGPSQHYADRDLLLVDTLDLPAFGIRFEKQRMAFRMAYSLLDKVAGFLNGYFGLGEDPNKVSLRTIWPTKGSIRPEFADRQNLPLRGLYWLSLDLLAEEPSDTNAIAPDAADLNRLRNALEHRCLVLREIETGLPSGIVETTTIADFQTATHRMMDLGRAALFYLSMAVRREEQRRDEQGEEPGIILSRSLNTYRGIVGYDDL